MRTSLGNLQLWGEINGKMIKESLTPSLNNESGRWTAMH